MQDDTAQRAFETISGADDPAPGLAKAQQPRPATAAPYRVAVDDQSGYGLIDPNWSWLAWSALRAWVLGALVPIREAGRLP